MTFSRRDVRMYCRPSTNHCRQYASPYDTEQGPFWTTTIHTVCWHFFVRAVTWHIRRLHDKLVREEEKQQEMNKAGHICLQKRVRRLVVYAFYPVIEQRSWISVCTSKGRTDPTLWPATFPYVLGQYMRLGQDFIRHCCTPGPDFVTFIQTSPDGNLCFTPLHLALSATSQPKFSYRSDNPVLGLLGVPTDCVIIGSLWRDPESESFSLAIFAYRVAVRIESWYLSVGIPFVPKYK